MRYNEITVDGIVNKLPDGYWLVLTESKRNLRLVYDENGSKEEFVALFSTKAIEDIWDLVYRSAEEHSKKHKGE